MSAMDDVVRNNNISFNASNFKYKLIKGELDRLSLDLDDFFELLMGIYIAKMKIDKKCWGNGGTLAR